MSKIRLLSSAERDVADALNWYLDRSVLAAERLEEEIDSVIAAIAHDPERFPRMDSDHRYALLKRFPFYVAYRIEQDEILILAV